jgi:hypothetical protein
MKQLLTVFLFACAGEKGDTASTCQPGSPGAGTISATVDGADWSAADLTYLWAGESLQLTTSVSAGWRLSVVAQSAGGGEPISQIIDAGAFPAEVRLEAGKGGFAVLYPESGPSASTNNGDGGLLVITGEVDGDLLGCLDFGAADDAGEVDLVGGVFRASPG